jgi:hypothetical protein
MKYMKPEVLRHLGREEDSRWRVAGMNYEKPEITFLQEAIIAIESSTLKGGWVMETAGPHKPCTTPAYESDE